jgi:hypothetical protein
MIKPGGDIEPAMGVSDQVEASDQGRGECAMMGIKMGKSGYSS